MTLDKYTTQNLMKGEYSIMKLVKWNIENKNEAKVFFKEIFTKEPWNDDWSDEGQLENYIVDLIGNRNSLT